MLLLLAGFGTTSGLIGNAVAAMLEAGAPLHQLVADPAGLAAATSPGPSSPPSPRGCAARTHEVELGARVLTPDTTVLAMLGAAGRDPAVHAAPDVFRRRGWPSPPGATRMPRARSGAGRCC